MTDQPSRVQSRFESVSRRAFMARALALGGALVVVPGLACSSDDSETFANPDGTNAPGTSNSAAGTTVIDPASSSVETPGSVPGTATAPSATSASGGAGLFPAGGHVAIAFTYARSGGGESHSPYIAVWIENQAGDMVKTVSLWYKSSKSKYLNELQRWHAAENSFGDGGGSDPVDTVSGATRVAGTYSVAWDGTDASGSPVALGDYYVCIEAAREKGPYELIRGLVSFDGAAATTSLDDNGELSGASVAIVV